ncbi:hypothetical protein [Hydrocarboniphaga sp.]|uniref:hypothetical protein n=1 Tax=Hydrocarboniphaga sp. TaxID=2033016 RepID=UPI003D0D0021
MISQLIDLLLGLSFIYFLFSTMTSTLVELMETKFKRRAILLERGIREVLGSVLPVRQRIDAELAALAAAFYDSPHISSLYRGEYPKQADGAPVAEPQFGPIKLLPSYIPPERFANAIRHLGIDTAAGELRERFAALQSQIYSVMGLPADASTEQQTEAIVAYFNESMQRVSSWYKRWCSFLLLLAGLTVAGAFNVDTLALISTLSQNAELRRQLVERALSLDESNLSENSALSCQDDEDCLDEVRRRVADQLTLAESAGLPIAWTRARWEALWQPGLQPGDSRFVAVAGALLYKLLGIALTALAISLGAPFWFEMLNRFVELRNAIKPKEAKENEAAEKA